MTTKHKSKRLSLNIPYVIEGYEDCDLSFVRNIISEITGRDVTVVDAMHAGEVHLYDNPIAIAYIPDDLSKRTMSRWAMLIREGTLDDMICNNSEAEIRESILPHEIVSHPEFRRAHFSRLMWHVKHRDGDDDTYSNYAANSLYENITKDSSLSHIIGDISQQDWSESLLKDNLMLLHVSVKLKQLGIIR